MASNIKVVLLVAIFGIESIVKPRGIQFLFSQASKFLLFCFWFFCLLFFLNYWIKYILLYCMVFIYLFFGFLSFISFLEMTLLNSLRALLLITGGWVNSFILLLFILDGAYLYVLSCVPLLPLRDKLVIIYWGLVMNFQM
jgi:hypothetical protein